MSRKRFLGLSHCLVLVLVLVSLLALLIPVSVVKADSVVSFPDPNLQAAIREAMDKPSGAIYQSDCDNLTVLFASYRGIVHLTGLEHCTSLKFLDLSGNQISDISPLSGLTGLQGLGLSYNQISDISPLSGLTGLTQWLYLSGNQISDFSPLSGLTSLTVLDLDWTQISDLSPLSGLTSLTELWLHENQISDLSPLSGLTSLTKLYLDTNQVSDLSPLSGLTSLTELWLCENQIGDLSPLSGCTKLNHLRLHFNEISDLSPLSGLTSLTELYLDSNQASDLSPLSGLTSLTVLVLSRNQISDIAPLSGLTSLTCLVLDTNRSEQISDISPLSGLTSLTKLYLSGNQISDLSPLSGLPGLTELVLGGNQISDLSPLSGLTSLTELYLDSNQISDFSPLSSLTSLTVLGLSSTQISNLSPLSDLTNLRWLWLGYNQISDLSPLSGLTSLTYLHLYSNQISDIEPLVSNPGMDSGDELYLGDNPLNADSVNVYIPVLQGRGVTVSWDTVNQPPNQPSNVSPANGSSAVSLMPTLETSAFSDPDAGDTHAASQWQITTTADNYTSPVFDSGTDNSDLTSIAVTSGMLSANTTYYWHVRYQDNRGDWSSWSSETSFSTAPPASLTGYVEDGHGHKLGGVEVTLLGLSPVVTITDDGGQYSFADIAPGTYQIEIALEYHKMVGDPATFSINYDAGPTVHAQTDNFQVCCGEVVKDISFADPSLNPAPGIPPALGIPKDRLDDLAAMYYHVKQVVDFESIELGISPDLSLPIVVHGYVSDNPLTPEDESKEVWYEAGDVYIGAGGSAYADFNRPMNREWHEMFHELMDDRVGIPPRHTGDTNHGGYANDCTGDSWVEGWAEFWPCALNRNLGVDGWYLYWGTTNFELNWQVWDSEAGWSREEFAVASLLVDLVDPVNPADNDFISLTNSQLWAIIGSTPLADMSQVYSALVAAGVGQVDSDTDGINDLNELFIAHGFFADDGNRRYDAGEVIGLGGKPGRPNTPLIPNANLRVTVTDAEGNPVDGTLIVNVVFPSPLDIYNYSYEVDLHGSDGLVYFEVAPGDVEALIHIRAKDHNGKLSDEYVVSNTAYWKEVEESTTGYAVEHTFVMAAENVAPAAADNSYSMAEDTTLDEAAPGVLGNDTDANLDPLTATLVNPVSHGTLTLNPNGSFSYTPAANFNGTDSFTYKASDGKADSNVATVTITVNAVNDAPVAVADSYSTDEDTALNRAAPGVLENDTDIDGDPLTAILVSNVSHGTLVLNADGSFTYAPAANYNGSDSFTYKANDGTTDSNVVTVTITVNAVNDAPLAPTGGAAYSTDENAVLNQAAPGVLGNCTDIDGNPLTAILVSNVSHGTLVLNANGSFTYTPAAGFTGSDSFTCKANDGTTDSNVFTVTITVKQLPPSITSLDRLEAAPGETITVVITGTKLGGATAVDFGLGVTIEKLTIDSASQITVDVKVASDAQPGLRDVSVTTPQGVATLTDAFTVTKAPSGAVPVWVWPVVALAVAAAGVGGFFLFFFLPRWKKKHS